MPRPRPAALATLLALTLGTLPAVAQDSGEASDRLEAVEAEMSAAQAEAERLRREANALAETLLATTREMVATAAEVQHQEAAVQGMEGRLAELTAQETAKAAEQEARSAELAATMSALTRLARRPPDALIAMPVSLTELYHTGRLMAALVPAIEQRARELADDMESLQRIRAEALEQQASLGPALAALGEKQTRLAALVSETARLRGEALGDQQAAAERAQALADEAASLRDLIDRLADVQTAEPELAEAALAEAAQDVAAQDTGAQDTGDGQTFVTAQTPDGALPPVPPAKPEPAFLVVAATEPAAGADAVPVEPVETEILVPTAGETAQEPVEEGAALVAPAEEAAVEEAQEPAVEAMEEPAPEPADGMAVAAVPPVEDAPPGTFAAAKGRLPMPAAGQIEVRFGEPRGDGSLSQGLVLDTREGAQVITPYDGEVVYAGPFRDYGQLLIIAHGGGYHSVLAGFAKIDATVGQWVLAGEPVGVVGSGPGGKATLYVEFRYDGQPIDPMPWLNATLDEGNG